MLYHDLVFLHGWGASSWVWHKQIRHFSRICYVQTPDLSAIRCPLSAILIGWSYGGMLAIDFAANNPGKIKALVLAGCSAKFTDGIDPIVIKNIRRGLSRDYEATMRNCYGTFFAPYETEFMDEFIGRQTLPDPKEAIEILDRLMVLDLRDILKNINIPTLIIHGDKDGVCPLDAAKYLAENIKGSRLAVIEGAGHMPFYTRPEEFNDILEGFLETID